MHQSYDEEPMNHEVTCPKCGYKFVEDESKEVENEPSESPEDKQKHRLQIAISMFKDKKEDKKA